MSYSIKHLINVFIDGILYFFGLEINPINKYKKSNMINNDLDNIKQDWENVGNDIKTSYEKFKTSNGIC